MSSIASFAPFSASFDAPYGAQSRKEPTLVEMHTLHQRPVRQEKEPSPFFSRCLIPLHYESPPYTMTPGTSNIIFAFFDAVKSFNGLIDSIKVKDFEGAFDAINRFLGAPMNLMNAFSMCVWYIKEYFKQVQIHVPIQKVSLSMSFFGLLLSVMEANVEVSNIFRLLNFSSKWYLSCILSFMEKFSSPSSEKEKQELINLLNSYSFILSKYASKENIQKWREELQESLLTPATTQKIKEELLFHVLKKFGEHSLSLNSQEKRQVQKKIANIWEGKQRKEALAKETHDIEVKKRILLGRRIQPWCTKVCERSIPDVLDKLLDQDPQIRSQGLHEGKELLKTVDTQVKKKLLVHYVGLAALALTALAWVAFLLPFAPVSLPATLLWLGFALGTARLIAYKGLLTTSGWHFSWRECIPFYEQISKLFYRILGKHAPAQAIIREPGPIDSTVLQLREARRHIHTLQSSLQRKTKRAFCRFCYMRVAH